MFDLGGKIRNVEEILSDYSRCDLVVTRRMLRAGRVAQDTHEHLKEPRLAGKPILVFANKRKRNAEEMCLFQRATD